MEVVREIVYYFMWKVKRSHLFKWADWKREPLFPALRGEFLSPLQGLRGPGRTGHWCLIAYPWGGRD
jgi:hypothetical protein